MVEIIIEDVNEKLIEELSQDIFPCSINEYVDEGFHCSGCYCKFYGSDHPIFNLNYAGALKTPLFRHFCSNKCMVQWLWNYATNMFGEKEVKKMLSEVIAANWWAN